MGMFDGLAKEALKGVLGQQGADFVANKMAQSTNPVFQHYRNKVDETFEKSSQKLQQNHPKFANACVKATNMLAEYGNAISGNGMNQPSAPAPQAQNPVDQLKASDPGNGSSCVDTSMWDFE
ncbi:MAG: hypothetical protein K6G22_11625 [Lachnospiraceae bacterium]|nr:hypothetical protein [Lachnospiraceae bacterium]